MNVSVVGFIVYTGFWVEAFGLRIYGLGLWGCRIWRAETCRRPGRPEQLRGSAQQGQRELDREHLAVMGEGRVVPGFRALGSGFLVKKKTVLYKPSLVD